VVAVIMTATEGGVRVVTLACDVRVATPRATFTEPGVAFGLFSAWGGTVRLLRVVGPTSRSRDGSSTPRKHAPWD
jgi:enoyl-CoA hydratase/carnithine racemase